MSGERGDDSGDAGQPGGGGAGCADLTGGPIDARVAGEEAALAEEARRLFAGKVEFLLSAPALKFLPEPGPPEVALWGRSNVGKSSLINALTGRRAIARASVTPGRTRELNVFEVGSPTRLRLVDMPGYGFAKVPLNVAGDWQRLVRGYLRGRGVLRRVLLLIDSRHGVKPSDRAMMVLLDEVGVGYRLVLTKADKVNAEGLAGAVQSVSEAARGGLAAHPRVLATSAAKGLGIAELRAAVLADSAG